MLQKHLFFLFLIFLFWTSYSSQRTLYVDNFNNILGSPQKEDQLLRFAQRNKFNVLMLYELNKVDKRFPLSDPRKNNILAEFIAKAKTSYGLKSIGASGEAASFFINIIDLYNSSRDKKEEKFDIYNLEYEYWSNKASGIDGYYCVNYLEENAIPCGREGSFQFFLKNLQDLNKLASSSKHKLEIEAYVSFYTQNEINQISKLCDRLVVRAFGKSPNLSYSSAKKNIDYLINVKSNVKTSILFSTNMNNLGRWLKFDTLDKGESIFKKEMKEKSNFSQQNVILDGFSYHTYSDLEKSISYYSYSRN